MSVSSVLTRPDEADLVAVFACEEVECVVYLRWRGEGLGEMNEIQYFAKQHQLVRLVSLLIHSKQHQRHRPKRNYFYHFVNQITGCQKPNICWYLSAAHHVTISSMKMFIATTLHWSKCRTSLHKESSNRSVATPDARDPSSRRRSLNSCQSLDSRFVHWQPHRTWTEGCKQLLCVAACDRAAASRLCKTRLWRCLWVKLAQFAEFLINVFSAVSWSSVLPFVNCFVFNLWRNYEK